MKSRKIDIAGYCRRALLWAAVSVAWYLPAGAVELPTLFTAEVPFDSTAHNGRDDAYRAALAEILQRVSGPELVRNRAAFEELFPNPASYVTQFRPGTGETLWVSFDGEAIEKALRASGQTFWGADRPLTLVWLAVDWGQGEREIIGADDPDRTRPESRSIDRNRLLRERLLEVAEHRGLPVVFPLLDTTDLQNVTFADIWGGFDDRVVEASRRYDASSILVGRIRPGSIQRARWSYYFGNDESSLAGPPEAVLGQVADRLAAELAVGGNLPLQSVTLRVSGVDSLDAYGSVQGMLNDIQLIERIAVAEVAGDSVSYRVDVRGGAERLGRALRFKGLVEQEQAGLPDPEATLEFYYNP